MRRYYGFFANSFKTNLVYKTEFFLYFIQGLFGFFLLYYLWSAVYNSTGQISGMDLNAIITYIVVSSLIRGCLPDTIMVDMGLMIRSGNLVSYLVRPIDLQARIFANQVGYSTFQLLFKGLPVLILGIAAFGAKTPPNLSYSLGFALSLGLSFILAGLIQFCAGLVAVWTRMIWGTFLFYEAIVGVLSGALVPLSFFPDKWSHLLMSLPFQALYHIPISFYNGGLQSHGGLRNVILSLTGLGPFAAALTEQLLWIAIAFLFSRLVWALAKRRVEIAGG